MKRLQSKDGQLSADEIEKWRKWMVNHPEAHSQRVIDFGILCDMALSAISENAPASDVNATALLRLFVGREWHRGTLMLDVEDKCNIERVLRDERPLPSKEKP